MQAIDVHGQYSHFQKWELDLLLFAIVYDLCLSMQQSFLFTTLTKFSRIFAFRTHICFESLASADDQDVY